MAGIRSSSPAAASTTVSRRGRRTAGNVDVWVMDADGGHLRRLTTSAGIDLGPAWSPDGKRIAFTSDRDGDLEIYVMRSSGAREVDISKNSSAWVPPAWIARDSVAVYTGSPQAS